MIFSTKKAMDMIEQMAEAVSKEAMKKVDKYLIEWQQKHSEEFGSRLEGWDEEIRDHIKKVIAEEYEKFKSETTKEEEFSEEETASCHNLCCTK